VKAGDYSDWQQGRKDSDTADKFFKKSWKRREGIAKATNKIVKEEVSEAKGPYQHEYNEKSVNDAIKSSGRYGKKIGKKEGSLIHRLLKGHSKPKPVKEEVEQLDELSKEKLAKYKGDAEGQILAWDGKSPNKGKKFWNRVRGLNTLGKKKAREAQNESVEQLDEISNSYLRKMDYVGKARKSISDAYDSKSKANDTIHYGPAHEKEAAHEKVTKDWKTIEKRTNSLFRAMKRSRGRND